MGRRIPPEKKLARLLIPRLNSLAKEIAKEAKAKRVRIEAEYLWTDDGHGSLKVRLWVSEDASNERGSDGSVQPFGTKAVLEIEEIVRRKIGEIK